MSKSPGFTLLELMVAVTIVSIMVAVVVVSISQSRINAKNSNILGQMDEYKKVLELMFHDLDGRYPIASNVSSVDARTRKMCIGEGAVGSCLGSISYSQPAPATNPFYTAASAYMPKIPRFEFVSGGTNYSAPALSGCIVYGGDPRFPVNLNNPDSAGKAAVCTKNHYSIWFLLQGANENCGEAITVSGTFGDGNDLTLCRLTPERGQ